MPYIGQGTRPEFDDYIEELAAQVANHSPGEHDLEGNLNYCITRLLLLSFRTRFEKFRYWMSTAMKGILGDVTDELYRRKVAPYEDKKIKENGDVREYQEDW